jgi:hypothetical protein
VATITRTYRVDDLDGSEEDVSTVHFALDKKDYEIDLSAANAERLREKLAKFLDVASPVKAPRTKTSTAKHRTTSAAPAPSGREQSQAIRDWARSQNIEVSSRGRIKSDIVAQFNAAH